LGASPLVPPLLNGLSFDQRYGPKNLIEFQ